MRGNTLTVRPWFAKLLRGAALALVCTGATGAPDEADDGLDRLLAEKALIKPAESVATGTGVVAQVRDKASDMVLAAMNFLDVPYRRGGAGEEGFDCSGFTRHVFELSLGLALPRRVDEQAMAPGLVVVRRDELKPGDLVFFNTRKRTFSHVGIYIGDGRFIHSPRTGGRVRLEDMRYTYWSKRYTGARRAELAQSTVASDVVSAADAAAPTLRAPPSRRRTNAAESTYLMY